MESSMYLNWRLTGRTTAPESGTDEAHTLMLRFPGLMDRSLAICPSICVYRAIKHQSTYNRLPASRAAYRQSRCTSCSQSL